MAAFNEILMFQEDSLEASAVHHDPVNVWLPSAYSQLLKTGGGFAPWLHLSVGIWKETCIMSGRMCTESNSSWMKAY